MRGQGLVETVLLLPVYLFFALGLLQLAQLGVALLVSSYAASTVARKAANEEALSTAATGVPVNLSAYDQKVNDLMVSGMQMDSPVGLIGCINRTDPTMPTAELQVAVRTKLQAWPFFADILHGAWSTQYAAQALVCATPANPGGFGPFNFSASAPYYFYVTGQAKVRLNYTP